MGKVYMDRTIGREVIAATIAKVWRVSRQARFQEIGSNIFSITFATQAEKMRVIEGRPWLFDNHLFILQLFNALHNQAI